MRAILLVIVLAVMLALLVDCGEHRAPALQASASDAGHPVRPALDPALRVRALAGVWQPDDVRVEAAGQASDVCYVKWSDLYWDPVQRTHYVWFTNGCPDSYYCYVIVRRGTQRNKYGWCVSGNSSYRIDIGLIGRDDKVEANAGNKC